MPTDPALAALDALGAAVDRARNRLDQVESKSLQLRQQRLAGRTFVEIVQEEEHPLVVELLTSILEDLADAGSAFRRAKAKALHDEGLSQEAIAAHFGVTRQRVAALLAPAKRSAPGSA